MTERGRPPEALFIFGEWEVSIRCYDARLGETISHLLRYHSSDRPRRAERQCEIVFELHPTLDERSSALVREDPAHGVWEWHVDPSAPGWNANRFYYLVLFPAICRVFPRLGLGRLHAAAIMDEALGTVLVLGDRGAGKSTFAASALYTGAKIATDDTVLVRGNDLDRCILGVRRELHVDPAVCRRLPGLRGLENSTEYLPGARRLSYDWIRHYPSSCAGWLEAPRHVILSEVGGRLTTAVPLPARNWAMELKRLLVDEAENALLTPGAESAVRVALARSTAWRVSWAQDVWKKGGRHIGFLREIVHS